MRVVHLISGSECQSNLLSAEALNLLNTLQSPNATPKEILKKCCQANLCPLVLKAKQKRS